MYDNVLKQNARTNVGDYYCYFMSLSLTQEVDLCEICLVLQ